MRDYLQRDPAGRRSAGATRALNTAIAAFPLRAELGGASVLRPAGEGPLTGLSSLAAELYDGAPTDRWTASRCARRKSAGGCFSTLQACNAALVHVEPVRQLHQDQGLS